MKIITISREFGSGGRELGKRLSDTLGIPCYDRKIIEAIAERYGYSEDYISHISEKEIEVMYPSTIGQSFAGYNYIMQPAMEIMSAQQKIIKELAGQSDCIVIGRCADIILKDLHPLNLFIYADIKSRLARCINRTSQKEHLTDREMAQKIKQIDKERAAYRKIFTDNQWGNIKSYHLCVDTSDREIKKLIPGLSMYTKCWFDAELSGN